MGKCKVGYALSEDGTIPQRCNVDWGDDFYPTVCKECPFYNGEHEGVIMNDVIKNLYTLFDAAFEENMNGRGTDITKMVTTFIPDAIQNLQAYEDLGFTPVEIAHMAKFYKDKHSVEEIEYNMKTAAKLMEWAKWKDLEAQGRLIVLSVEDIHPCKYCDSGWGSISSEGCKSCHDDCERLKQYNKKYNN